MSPGGGVLEVLHDGVGTWIQDGLVPGVAPSHDVWRTAVGSAHLEYLAVAVRVTAIAAPDNDAIADCCVHSGSPSFSPIRIRAPPGSWQGRRSLLAIEKTCRGPS